MFVYHTDFRKYIYIYIAILLLAQKQKIYARRAHARNQKAVAKVHSFIAVALLHRAVTLLTYAAVVKTN